MLCWGNNRYHIFPEMSWDIGTKASINPRLRALTQGVEKSISTFLGKKDYESTSSALQILLFFNIHSYLSL